MKCIVKDCENHSNEGKFKGDICYPCYAFITNGEGVHSQVYRNTKREWVGLTDEEVEQVFPAIATYHAANKTLYRSIARAIEDKLKEKNHG